MEVEIRPLKKFVDQRGFLLKILELSNLKDYKQQFGEIYLSVALPGIKRACHYHEKTTEWFTVIKGCGLLTLRDLSSGEEKQITLDDQEPCMVCVKPGIYHEFISANDEPVYLLAYADKEYDPQDTDTFRID